MAEAEKADGAPGPADSPLTDGGAAAPQGVNWTASEFIAHEKSTGWYTSLAIITIVAAVLIFLITRDKVSVSVVIVAGFILGVYGSHKPRQLEYRVDQSGVTIGGKFYDYHLFKSFSVSPEGAFAGITFMPLRRFAVPVTIYYSPGDEARIMDILTSRLPFEEHRDDAIDSLMRRIRF